MAHDDQKPRDIGKGRNKKCEMQDYANLDMQC